MCVCALPPLSLWKRPPPPSCCACQGITLLPGLNAYLCGITCVTSTAPLAQHPRRRNDPDCRSFWEWHYSSIPPGTYTHPPTHTHTSVCHPFWFLFTHQNRPANSKAVFGFRDRYLVKASHLLEKAFPWLRCVTIWCFHRFGLLFTPWERKYDDSVMFRTFSEQIGKTTELKSTRSCFANEKQSVTLTSQETPLEEQYDYGRMSFVHCLPIPVHMLTILLSSLRNAFTTSVPGSK